MRIKEAELYTVRIPFKIKFKHAKASRDCSDNIILKIVLEDGTVGFGECIARDYVSGETTNEAIKNIKKNFKQFKGKDFNSFGEAVNFLKKVKPFGAGQCAVELAVLDAYGKSFKKPASEPIGRIIKDKVEYSGVISADFSFLDLLKYKLFGFRFIKLKAGFDDDLERVRRIRKVLGNVDLRIDANCAWGADEAIKKIIDMGEYKISAVEQPVGKDDIAGLKKVAENASVPIVADESLCTFDDAKKLMKIKNLIFDIRISKNGGLLNSLKIYNTATKKGIKCQLGAMVGETGILTAAGRHFACSAGELKYLEGSYNKFLLKEDIVKEDMSFGFRGIAKALSGYGLGVNVDEARLQKYCTCKVKI